MKNRMKRLAAHWVVLAMILMMAAPVVADTAATIEGEVNDVYQIVSADGQVYEIGDDATGNELAESYIGQKVRVNGTVTVGEGGIQVIMVADFETLAE